MRVTPMQDPLSNRQAASLSPLHSNTRNIVAEAPENCVITYKSSLPPDQLSEPPSPPEACYRHSGWQAARLQVWEALLRCRVGEHRLDAFACCGSRLTLQITDEGDTRLVSNHCHDRFCRPCGAARASRMAANLQNVISNLRNVRFVTLTLRHNALCLTDQLNRLYKCFGDLRRRKWWQSLVKGGCAMVEITLGRDKRWHPHLHLIVEGRYMAQSELSAEWLRVTGDSSIVDIRAIRDDGADYVARYVTKYVCKPMSDSVLADPDKLAEMIEALRGRRLCLTYGSWRGTRLDVMPDDTTVWHTVMRVQDIIAAYRRGDETAAKWLRVLQQWYPGVAYSWGLPGPAPPGTPS